MTTAPAQLDVLMSGGFGAAYEQLLPDFERETGIKVATGSGASQGAGPHTIAAQLARGAPADVVILSREGLGDLIAANKIVAGTDVDLARVPLGVAVRTGTAKPDVSTVEAFKQILLKANSVAIPKAPAASGSRPICFRGSALRTRSASRRCRAVPPPPASSPKAPRTWRSCRSARSCTPRALTSPAASRRRFSSCRFFQPPSWPAPARSKHRNG